VLYNNVLLKRTEDASNEKLKTKLKQSTEPSNCDVNRGDYKYEIKVHKQVYRNAANYKKK